MKKLQNRMLIYILLPSLLFFIGTIIYVFITVKDMSVKEADQMLKTNGESLSYQLQLELEKPLISVETLSGSFKGVIESGTIPRRESANSMLQQLLVNNPEYLSAWMFWDENAFDGKDEEYVNEEGHDHTGRFIPA